MAVDYVQVDADFADADKNSIAPQKVRTAATPVELCACKLGACMQALRM